MTLGAAAPAPTKTSGLGSTCCSRTTSPRRRSRRSARGRLRGVVRRRGRHDRDTVQSGSASRRRSRLGAVTAAYEAYNTLVVLVVPEYRTTAFVGHHAATFVLALLSQGRTSTCGLFGVASVSSVPLAVVEVAKCAGLTRLHDRARGIYAAAFLALRSLYWPLVSLGLGHRRRAARRRRRRPVAAVVTSLSPTSASRGSSCCGRRRWSGRAEGARAARRLGRSRLRGGRRPLKAAG